MTEALSPVSNRATRQFKRLSDRRLAIFRLPMMHATM
jgi:hypothetical protein